MRKIKNLYRKIITYSYWKFILGSLGDGSIIFSPMMIVGANKIFIGRKVCIRDGARIEVVRNQALNILPELKIGNNVNIEQGVHVICQSRVVIEDNVSITPYCAIVDTYHPFDPPDTLPKIGDRLPDEKTFVRIGAGSFIGAHSVILPNVEIGKGCVVGAGSVVSKSVPDYCVVSGVPAKVIKKFDQVNRQWMKVI